MVTNRRAFLRTGSALVFSHTGPVPLPSKEILEDARKLIRGGVLGPVSFCRVPDRRLLTAVRSLLPREPDCLTEVQPVSDSLALLGRDATLVVSCGGCRLFARI